MFPAQLYPLADKATLLKNYKGKNVEDLPTPSFVVDRGIFHRNCERMLSNATKLKADFRAHVKTHKTLEGTRLQLGTGSNTTDRIVVSTLLEAWGLMQLVEDGLIKDILFSLPVVKSRLGELAALSSKVQNLRLMLDNVEQLDTLSEYNKQNPGTKKWSIFLKINMGTDRAGLVTKTDNLDETLKKLLTDNDTKDNVELYGFYAHAGHSYSSDSQQKAKTFLLHEITHVNEAAKAAIEIDPSLNNLQLSVGATPTAHASEVLSNESVSSLLGEELSGNLELHAGNYPFCDLQQVATNCIGYEDVSCKVMAQVLSTYPNRGTKRPGEQLVNAGVIALAREFGPIPGHGKIVKPSQYNNWIVGRLSQEHGICVPLDESVKTEFIPLDTIVSIVPQHSCITAASYPWYYVTDGSDEVVDVWVPYRGW
ncbi:uncharacterized protein PRCAT00003517001 [Priceomyces carsonii]|uniref:uncharacterized protein n=1 Tax=Priceomyces carsonii TaxID=28549 RepID=UPI002ED861CF|nr:unnamed protein product [Priceomyces carsonii]